MYELNKPVPKKLEHIYNIFLDYSRQRLGDESNVHYRETRVSRRLRGEFYIFGAEINGVHKITFCFDGRSAKVRGGKVEI